MMRRNTQVGQHSVNLRNTKSPELPTHETKIAFNESETFVMRDISPGVGILVKAEKTTSTAKCRKDQSAVSAAPESKIHIYAIGLDIKQFDRLFRQHRYVVILHGVQYV